MRRIGELLKEAEQQEAALQALREELKNACLSSKSPCETGSAKVEDLRSACLAGNMTPPRKQAPVDNADMDDRRRLREALASTAARTAEQFEQFSSLLKRIADESGSDDEAVQQRPRARSEGAALAAAPSALLRPARRYSRGSRRVSWADEPEPDPANSPDKDDKEDGSCAFRGQEDCSSIVRVETMQTYASASRNRAVLMQSPRRNATDRGAAKAGIVVSHGGFRFPTARGRQAAAPGGFRFGVPAPTRAVQEAPSHTMDFI